MKKRVITMTAVLAAILTAPAVPTLTLTPLGTLQAGGLRDEDPRIAEINAYDASGRRVYIVNPEAGVLDVIDISTPGNPVKAPSVDLVAACNLALGSADCPIEPPSGW